MRAEGSHHGLGILAVDVHEQRKPGVPLDESRDVGIPASGNEVAFPMPGNGSVLDRRGSMGDRDTVDNLATTQSSDIAVPRLTDHPLGPSVLLELFFQPPTRLNEEASRDGLVRHLQALIIQVGPLEPAGDLFRRPVQRQLAGHYTPEPAIERESTEFRTTCAIPGGLICLVRTIPLLIGVLLDLTADGRRRTSGLPGNLTQRRAGRCVGKACLVAHMSSG